MTPRTGQIWELKYPHGYHMLVDIEERPNKVYLYSLFSFDLKQIVRWPSPFHEIPTGFTVLDP